LGKTQKTSTGRDRPAAIKKTITKASKKKEKKKQEEEINIRVTACKGWDKLRKKGFEE